MIVRDLSFLIRGVRIMETRRLSFYMCFLDHLHHSIIWQGGFDFGPGPCALAWVGSLSEPSCFIGFVPRLPS